MTVCWEAINDMLDDNDTTLTALRVYLRISRKHPDITEEPHAVKEWLLARDMKMTRKTVRAAINLLIAKGHLTECGRGRNNVRILRATRVADYPPSQAA